MAEDTGQVQDVAAGDATSSASSDAPPDLSPPAEFSGAGDPGSVAADPAPVPAPQPSIDYDRLGQTYMQANASLMQQFAPKPAPQPQPWDKPEFWELPQGPDATRLFHERIQQFADARAEAKVKAVADSLRQEFAQVLQGRDAYMQARFASDPNFTRIEAHFQKYVREGLPAQYARRLAEQDAGAAAPQQGAAQSRPAVPQPPKHMTTPQGRSGAAPAQRPSFDFRNENHREAHFKSLAAKFGYPD